MNKYYNFAFIVPDENSQEIDKYKSFLEKMELSVLILPHSMESLDQIANFDICKVIVYDNQTDSFARKLIIEASVRKMFKKTTFYNLAKDKPDDDQQIILMSIGYAGFLELEFSADEARSIIDLHDYRQRAA